MLYQVKTIFGNYKEAERKSIPSSWQHAFYTERDKIWDRENCTDTNSWDVTERQKNILKWSLIEQHGEDSLSRRKQILAGLWESTTDAILVTLLKTSTWNRKATSGYWCLSLDTAIIAFVFFTDRENRFLEWVKDFPKVKQEVRDKIRNSQSFSLSTLLADCRARKNDLFSVKR